MAQVTITAGWMTSFIYEQDLTSYYMNNVLTGTFRPGVYNANIAIVQGPDALYLSIKKGTTLLFSNNYKKSDDLPDIGCRRNFSNIKNEVFNNPDNTSNESIVLIKCVAQNDIFQKIASKSDEEILGQDITTLYVFSYIKYMKSPLSGEEDSSIPTFILTKNHNFTRIPGAEQSTDNYLYETVFPVYNYDSSILYTSENVKDNIKYFVPDGCVDYSLEETSRYLQNYSFLTLGILIKSQSAMSTSFKNNLSSWTQNFTFTSHGLPEYRHTMMSDHNIMCPDIIMYSKKPRATYDDPDICSTAFIDLPNTLIKNSVYNRRIEKKDISLDDADYCWEYCYDNVKVPDSQYDFVYQQYLDSEGRYTIDDKIDFTLTEEDRNEINKYTDNALVIDAIYGTSKSEIVGNDETTLYDFSNINFQNNIKYSNYRIITTISNSTDKDKIFNIFNYKTDEIWYSSSALSGNDIKVLPLDVCEHNINRLLPLIQNKNLWSKIIDKIRLENDQYPEETSNIIPIALVFRCFSKNYQDKMTFDLKDTSMSNIYTFDTLSNITSINPIDMISYFDLCNKMTKINVLNLDSENVFNLIPILK